MSHNHATHMYLVRHGETDWNREQRLQGVLDVPLNETGVAQARRLADYFAVVPIAGVVTSPLVRASVTAAVLAEVCACPLQIDPRLREIDHGSWSGLTLPDIGQRCPAFVRNRQLTAAAFDVSGGESLSEASRRASDALADLLSAYDGQAVLVVGHGITLALMWCAANGLDHARFHEHLSPNAGVVFLTFSRRQLADARTLADAMTATRSGAPR
jgi:broad specificity phosphatase PhoE